MGFKSMSQPRYYAINQSWLQNDIDLNSLDGGEELYFWDKRINLSTTNEEIVAPMSGFDLLKRGFKHTFSFAIICESLDETRKPSFIPVPWEPRKAETYKQNSILAIHKLSGWRGGLCLNIIIIFTIMVINTSFLIWAPVKFNTTGEGVLYSGKCTITSKLSLFSHTIINILSTLMLGASNYAMQVIGSPARADIDEAHRLGSWMDIGCQSYRNLRFIPRGRQILFIILGLLSLPLHLMYNSAVFLSLGATQYEMLIVPKGFISGDDYNYTQFSAYWDGNHHIWNLTVDFPGSYESSLQKQAIAGNFTKLNVQDCIHAYEVTYQTIYGNVLAVSTDSNLTTPEGYQPDVLSASPDIWLCGDWSDTEDASCKSDITRMANKWILNNHTIDYCLVQPLEFEECELRFSLPLLVCVAFANLGKLICLIVMLWTLKEPTLVTIGDAIASFIQVPDKNTRGFGIMDKYDFWYFNHEKFKGDSFYDSAGYPSHINFPRAWNRERRRWHDSLSSRHWFGAICVCAMVVLILSSIFVKAAFYVATQYGAPSPSIGFLASLGIGSILTKSLWNIGTSSTLSGVLLANFPQLALSMGYFMINQLFTIMVTAHEWRGFATKHQYLRVTSPKGSQRSKHFLQIPYRYALIFLSLSIALHYFTSESLFLARINVYSAEGVLNPDQSISQIGYSAISIFITTMLCLTVLIFILVIGYIPTKAGIPMVGTCSAAISAACHCLESEPDDLILKPIRWGEVYFDGEVGHCAFSAGEVNPVRSGRKYM